MSYEEYYEQNEWKEIERFACKLCSFDTLNGEVVMNLHMVSVHFPPELEIGAVPSLATVSRFGKIIEPEEVPAPLEVDLSEMNVTEILELVERGELDATLVVESESEGKGRKSILKDLGSEE